ncbi:uncharacterized protein LOC131330092 [Rhododendron vialii]|uniref:uncharacterized protein LOC131330092 n=1 Tax=Rhododendron vialii TaxID=182163 RepID=UPI00265FCD2D|nr:uncharacterized protein LOC131330092 [Rhododendron vialii]
MHEVYLTTNGNCSILQLLSFSVPCFPQLSCKSEKEKYTKWSLCFWFPWIQETSSSSATTITYYTSTIRSRKSNRRYPAHHHHHHTCSETTQLSVSDFSPNILTATFFSIFHSHSSTISTSRCSHSENLQPITQGPMTFKQ